MTVRNGFSRWLVAAGLLICLTNLAAGPPKEAPVRARPEDLSRWSSYHVVSLDKKTDPPGALFDVILTPPVFGTAREDLGDLRLVDARGRFVPYALRIRQAIDERRELSARVFDRVVSPDRSVQLSLDLGENPGEYDQLTVEVPGVGFVRGLHVEGSSDGKDWRTVLDNAHVMRLNERDDAGRPIDRHRFVFHPARFRYLRIQVRPDAVMQDDRPQLGAVRVFRTVVVPGEDVTHLAALGRREPVRILNLGQPGSAWVLDLGWPKVPCRRLTVQCEETDFSRPVQMEDWAERGFYPIGVRGDGQLRSRKAGSHEAVLDLGSELRSQRLRLNVVDGGNPPLTITEVRYTAAARQVVFAVPAGVQEPLRLYTGNPEAPPPNYDFAANLPPRPDPAPTRLELGEREANPSYQPPPLPWTERWPYLVDVILGGACVVLLGILMMLARQAIHKHDTAAQPS
jgi:hypothetical protein